jgi:hypothetical protein
VHVWHREAAGLTVEPLRLIDEIREVNRHHGENDRNLRDGHHHVALLEPAFLCNGGSAGAGRRCSTSTISAAVSSGAGLLTGMRTGGLTNGTSQINSANDQHHNGGRGEPIAVSQKTAASVTSAWS